MILYFSGTGNSRYLSEVLNSEIKDEIISINDCLKTKKKYYVRIRTYYCVKGKRVYSYWCKVKTGRTRK